MKAAAYYKPHKIEVSEITKPALTTNGALIRVKGCGLCGSDIVKFKHGTVADGTILGHEIAGEIVEIQGTDKFKVGDLVVAGHHVPCYSCTYCKNGNFSMCKQFKQTNIIPGGFAEYIFVSEKHLNNTVFKIPTGLSLEAASYTEPLACCIRAVKRAGVKEGDNVLVIGLGSIGLLMGQACKSFGAEVTGCDLIDNRIAISNTLGFENSFKYSTIEESLENYKKNYELGADKVFLVSGSSSSLPFAIKAARDGGTICVFSSVGNDETGFPNNEIYYRELNIIGSYSPEPSDLKLALDLISSRAVKVDGFAVKYKLEELDKAIQDTVSNRILKAFIEI